MGQVLIVRCSAYIILRQLIFYAVAWKEDEQLDHDEESERESSRRPDEKAEDRVSAHKG